MTREYIATFDYNNSSAAKTFKGFDRFFDAPPHAIAVVWDSNRHSVVFALDDSEAAVESLKAYIAWHRFNTCETLDLVGIYTFDKVASVKNLIVPPDVGEPLPAGMKTQDLTIELKCPACLLNPFGGRKTEIIGRKTLGRYAGQHKCAGCHGELELVYIGGSPGLMAFEYRNIVRNVITDMTCPHCKKVALGKKATLNRRLVTKVTNCQHCTRHVELKEVQNNRFGFVS